MKPTPLATHLWRFPLWVALHIIGIIATLLWLVPVCFIHIVVLPYLNRHTLFHIDPEWSDIEFPMDFFRNLYFKIDPTSMEDQLQEMQRFNPKPEPEIERETEVVKYLRLIDKLENGDLISLITPEELLTIKDGTMLCSINGEMVEKTSKLDLDTRCGFLAYGFKYPPG